MLPVTRPILPPHSDHGSSNCAVEFWGGRSIVTSASRSSAPRTIGALSKGRFFNQAIPGRFQIRLSCELQADAPAAQLPARCQRREVSSWRAPCAAHTDRQPDYRLRQPRRCLPNSFPSRIYHAVLDETKRASVRERDLPAHVVGLLRDRHPALYNRSSIARFCAACWRECSGCWIRQPLSRWPASRALSQARSRLGPESLLKLVRAHSGRNRGEANQGRVVLGVAIDRRRRQHAGHRRYFRR